MGEAKNIYFTCLKLNYNSAMYDQNSFHQEATRFAEIAKQLHTQWELLYYVENDPDSVYLRLKEDKYVANELLVEEECSADPLVETTDSELPEDEAELNFA